MVQRGTTEDEVAKVLAEGSEIQAKKGRKAKEMVFPLPEDWQRVAREDWERMSLLYDSIPILLEKLDWIPACAGMTACW